MKRFVICAAVIGLAVSSGVAHALPGVVSRSILSGSGWLVTTDPGVPDCPGTGCLKWTTTAYDDSAWVTPTLSEYNGATNVNNVLPGTTAQFMWYPSDTTVAYFRYKFYMSANSLTPPLAATAFVEADDFYELWVNGQFVISGLLDQHDFGINMLPQSADITPYLQRGKNVIAIRANDGSCKTLDPLTGLCSSLPFAPDGTYNGKAFSNVFRNVFFDGVIKTVQ